MKPRLRAVSALMVLAFLLALAQSAIGSVVSANREFNATQDSIFLNYTNSYSQNITLWSNASYEIFVNISNSSTAISSNYSQANSQTACQQPNIGFLAMNASGILVADRINISAVGNNTNLTLSFNSMLSCLPGRYWGGFVIKNSTNTTENLTINAVIDIPISSNNYNSLPQSGTTGAITAVMPGNASAFHRYYFNSSEVNRSAAITINMSSAQDLDLFLFDGSSPARLLARSANKSNSSERLTYWPLTPNTMYEIRIFGNITNVSSTAYTFYTIFSTLNASYTADAGQPASNISFGSLNASGRNIQNITLKNEGNITMANVTESRELYYVKRWEINTSSSTLFDGLFLVPSFATKIRIAANWTNATQNYSIYLTAPNRTLISSSNGKFLNANFTNASLEEYIEINENATGYWNASVRHNAGAGASNYTLAAFVWYPVSEWISTNYSARTFNTSGNANSSANVQINFTASNNSIDGNYEGFVQYATAQGAVLRLPFAASVNASSLVANSTIGSASVQIDENIGANLTKVLNITLNNTGRYPLPFTIENSSSALSSGSNYINFTYQAPVSPLSAGANHLLNITLQLDPNTTRNVSGVYEGFIKFVTNDSRPYQNFTLTLRVNLTNDLNVVVSGAASVDGDSNWVNQTGAAENITAMFNTYYINDSASSNPINSLNTTNFTAWLTSANVSYRIPTSGSLSIYNGTNPIYSSSRYNLNLTIPASQPGGAYQLHIGANYSRGDGYTFKGESVYDYLHVNNSGLAMSTQNSTSISIANGSSAVFAANVSNYGNLAGSSATIQFSENCGYSAAVTGSTGCSGSQDGTTFTVSPAANSRTCMVWWTITAGSSAADACTANIIGAAGTWYDARGINVSVTVTGSGTSTTTTTTATTTTSNTTTPATNTTPASALTITSFPSETKIAQNASANVSISVKNSGDTNLTGVKFYVDGINQSWYVQPAAQNLSKGAEKNYSIVFNIPASAGVASYPINFVANNSAATKSASASLIVIPNNQTAAQILTNFTSYVLKYNELSLFFNQTKARGVNSTNLTDAEASLNQAKDLLDKANAYINAGDYYNAFQLIGQIDSLMKSAEQKLADAQNASAPVIPSSAWIMIVGIVAAVFVAGFVIYIAIPPKQGFDAGIGYSYVNPGARGKSRLDLAKERLKNAIDRIKEKLKKTQKPVQAYTYKENPRKQPFVYKGPSLDKD